MSTVCIKLHWWCNCEDLNWCNNLHWFETNNFNFRGNQNCISSAKFYLNYSLSFLDESQKSYFSHFYYLASLVACHRFHVIWILSLQDSYVSKIAKFWSRLKSARQQQSSALTVNGKNGKISSLWILDSNSTHSGQTFRVDNKNYPILWVASLWRLTRKIR